MHFSQNHNRCTPSDVNTQNKKCFTWGFFLRSGQRKTVRKLLNFQSYQFSPHLKQHPVKKNDKPGWFGSSVTHFLVPLQ